MRNTLIFFLLLFTQISFSQDYLDEGLYFWSREVNQDQRTSLNLTPNIPITLKNGFSLEFEANFRLGDGKYGNIFKIIGDENLNIDFAAHLNTTKLKEGSSNFWLVVKDTMLFKYNWSDIPKGDFDKWMQFKLEIDTEASLLTLTINGDKTIKQTAYVKGLEDIEIVFGKSNHKKFSTTDVCPMSVKNIKIFNKDKKLLRNWNLGKHTTTNKVYDNVTNDEAFVENPKWLIDQHVFWQKNKNFDFEDLLGTAKDEERDRIFFIDSKAVYVYSLTNDTMDTLNYPKNQLKCQSNSFIYNKYKNELIAYSIDERSYNKFDFENSKWEHHDNECIETSYLHHNKMISPKDSTLVTFGGYGYYQYKGEINNFNPISPELLHFDISDHISPRYLSSSGILNNDNFLIFGGYGSPTGNQNINSQFYYDLYSVAIENSENRTIKKFWEFDNADQKPFVPVQSMVIDKNSDSFYTLIFNNTLYNTHLKLVQFGINEQKLTVYPDSIPYEFLDIRSNADFFLDKNKTKLFTLTTLENKASLFSLTYPPLFAEDIYQEEIDEPVQAPFPWFFIAVVIVIAIIVFIIIRKRAPKPYTVDSKDSAKINEEVQNISHSKTEKIKRSAIYLFGGFQVYDNEGTDITGLFTPTLKQLFIVILLSGVKNDKGISSSKLTELLWPNKTENSARNNRNVNISKLRLLLDRIGPIEISNKNTYWSIHIDDSIFCDYSFVNNTLRESVYSTITSENIYKLLNIVYKGEISPDIQSDWMEEFNAELTDLLIDDLLRIAINQEDLHLLVLIGNTILKYAPLNEEAISLKCRSLFKLGKKGTSKQSYNRYCKEYLEILDAKFDKSFIEIIS